MFKLRPVAELAKYVRHVDKEVAGLVLPDLERSETVFEVEPIAAWVKDDLISIKFLIALVYIIVSDSPMTL